MDGACKLLLQSRIDRALASDAVLAFEMVTDDPYTKVAFASLWRTSMTGMKMALIHNV